MSDNEETAPGRIVLPTGEPARDEARERFNEAATLAARRQHVEEAKFAMLVELCQAIEELSDTVWAVAGQLLPAGKGRRARVEFETLQAVRQQRHEEHDAATIDNIRGVSDGK